MGKHRRQVLARLAIAALYALAMASLPFAHRQPATAAAPDLSAYALPDGTLPILCTTNPNGSGKSQQGSGTCDACRLTSAPGLVLPALAALPPPKSVTCDFLPAHNIYFIARQTRLHDGQPRAPPLA